MSAAITDKNEFASDLKTLSTATYDKGVSRDDLVKELQKAALWVMYEMPESVGK